MFANICERGPNAPADQSTELGSARALKCQPDTPQRRQNTLPPNLLHIFTPFAAPLRYCLQLFCTQLPSGSSLTLGTQQLDVADIWLTTACQSSFVAFSAQTRSQVSRYMARSWRQHFTFCHLLDPHEPQLIVQRVISNYQRLCRKSATGQNLSRQDCNN